VGFVEEELRGKDVDAVVVADTVGEEEEDDDGEDVDEEEEEEEGLDDM
jgi:hypothetical protein